MFERIIFYRETLITIGIVLLCLILYGLFPTSNYFQEFVSTLTFFVVLPFLYIKLILKKNLSVLGLAAGNWKKGLLWALVSLVLGLLVIYIFIQYGNFADKYFLPLYIYRFSYFVMHELLLVGYFVLIYEFFFRGFVQFSLMKHFGFLSVLLQAGLFFLFFAVTKNLEWSIFPYLLFAPLAGLIAYQSRSLFYSFSASLLFIILNDALIITFKKIVL